MRRLHFVHLIFLLSCLNIGVSLKAPVTSLHLLSHRLAKLRQPGIVLHNTTRPHNQLPSVLASSFCVAALLYPLDLIRTLQMSSAAQATRHSTLHLLTHFVASHGLRGMLTQGLGPELLRSTWIRFIKFGAFPVSQRIVRRHFTTLPASSSAALAAVLVSIPEVLSSMPLEIAKLALQFDRLNALQNNLLQALQHVYIHYGMAGLYAGYIAVQLRNAVWSAAYFASLPHLNRRISSCTALSACQGGGVLVPLLSGFLAGIFGTLLNTPFDNLRLLMQRLVLTSSPITLPTAVRHIVAARGWLGLYTGVVPKAIQLGAGGALMALLQPMLDRLFMRLAELRRQKDEMK